MFGWSFMVACSMAMENFITINVFCLSLRCFQIIEAKNDGSHGLTKSEYFALIMRKLGRIAIIYYPCWLICYVAIPRISDGPFYDRALSGMSDECLHFRDYWPTLFLVGNIFPDKVVPFTGCY